MSRESAGSQDDRRLTGTGDDHGPVSSTRGESCAFGTKGNLEKPPRAATAEGTASGAAATVRAPLAAGTMTVARCGGPGGRWSTATTGRQRCAFEAEGHQRRGLRAAAAERTASGAAEGAAGGGRDTLGRPYLIGNCWVVVVVCVFSGRRKETTVKKSCAKGDLLEYIYHLE